MANAAALFDLTGRVAVVTGGGGALGSVAAAGLASAGAAVALVDVRGESAIAAADGISAGGADAVGLGADLSDEAEVERVFGEVDGGSAASTSWSTRSRHPSTGTPPSSSRSPTGTPC